MLQYKSNGRSKTGKAGVPSYSGEDQTFVLFKLSIHWMNPTHIREDNLLYSPYQFKCQTHPKTFS